MTSAAAAAHAKVAAGVTLVEAAASTLVEAAASTLVEVAASTAGKVAATSLRIVEIAVEAGAEMRAAGWRGALLATSIRRDLLTRLALNFGTLRGLSRVLKKNKINNFK
jgi:hypothetical protein